MKVTTKHTTIIFKRQDKTFFCESTSLFYYSFELSLDVLAAYKIEDCFSAAYFFKLNQY